jgi:signal-transduction protein with cAMP-binding, CBS, and nucleotidyltransferase domain
MSISQQPIIRARDAMRRDLHFIEGMANAKEAADQMRANKVEALVVNKRHPDDAYGVVSMIDLLQGVVAANRPPEQVNVYEIMTKPVITVPADMDIRYVVRLLLRAKIRRAPVEDKGEYVGMITLTDLVMDGTLC